MRQRSESRMVPIYQLCRWRNAYHKSRRKSLWNPASNRLRTPTGTHPRPSTKAAPVTVMACVNINERNGGCFHSFNVGVKFCPDNYFVYYLVPMPSCSIAYCAGKISLKAVNRSTMFEGETSAVNYWPVSCTFNIQWASTSRAAPYRQKFLRS